MADENKIMTVSYGTFSCTLEGFDDPMGTMREMAEYFRDLSAHDRFFGAEPLQADPETMHRLAQQQAQQQIAAQPLAQQQPAPQQAAIPAAPIHPGPVAPEPAATAPKTAYVPPQPAPASPVARQAPTGIPQRGMVSPLAAAVAAAPMARNAALKADTADAGDSSVAEKLKRLRSAVKTEQEARTDYSEDEHAIEEPVDDTATALVNDDLDTEALAETDEANLSHEVLAEEDVVIDVEENALVSDSAFTEAGVEDEDLGVENLLDDVELDEEIDAAEIIADPDPTSADESSADQAATTKAQSTPVVPSSIGALPTDVIDAGAVEKIELKEAPKKAEPTPRAPVTGNYDSFSDFARSFASSEDSDKNQFDFAGSDSAPTDTSGIAAAKPDATPSAAPEQNATRAEKQARREAMTQDEDQALERLMSATSSRLEDSEGSVRRASIAHLKAAVAATKADSSIADAAAAKEEAELDQYRADLARVVRPGKGGTDADGSKIADRPSPLVLVSEQRIADDEASAEDVRPRRVGNRLGAETPTASVQKTAEAVADFEDDTNIFAENETETFTAYIARHQVKELPEMLEAAAAHYSFVENIQQFTRPMLMRKVSTIAPDNAVSREDGLRAFGTLLREGKIVKDEDGKFVIASNSRFMQESRIAGE